MILKALYDYYERSKDQLAPLGLESKEIAYIIVIDKEGNFIRLENTFDEDNNPSSFLVPKSKIRTGKNACSFPNIGWDKISSVLNFSKETIKDSTNKKNEEYFLYFKNEIEKICKELPNNASFKAISRFYEKYGEQPWKPLEKDREWTDFCKNLDSNISFKIQGESFIVPEDKEFQQWIIRDFNENKEQLEEGLCLVTGTRGPIVRTFTPTPITKKEAQAKLISFQKKQGYDSYGKLQGANAPISKEADFKYSTALNFLLRKGSKNVFRIGSRVYVFWASSKNKETEEFEESFFSFFNSKAGNEDNPNRHIQKVEKVFNAVHSGKLSNIDNEIFYILGLAPNKTRDIVVYWNEIPIKEFAANLLRHFDDMEIIDGRKEKRPYKGVYQMMSAVTLKGKVENVQPNLPESTIKSILQGTPYPYSLYMACLRRVRAGEEKIKDKTVSPITTGRIAILKAYLNRKINHQKFKDMLDTSNTNIGYLCGRLFATLEQIQYLANRTDTIRQRFINAASTTPMAVFPTLLKLSVHHEVNLHSNDLIKLKRKIIDMFPVQKFPAHLNFEEQGCFFVGYYQQKTLLCMPKKENKLEENNAE